MLGLTAKPEKFSGFTPVAELETSKPKERSKHESVAIDGVHPKKKSDHSDDGGYSNNDGSNLDQVHEGIFAC